jgi:DNA helicase II / ATP-dependent DNA helicase PcrA
MVLKVSFLSESKSDDVGLEWPVVFIPGVHSGSFPVAKTTNLDEERRLLYVAMTRAQGLLYLSYFQDPTYGDGISKKSSSDFSQKQIV